MNQEQSNRLPAQQVAQLHEQYAESLRRYLIGILGNAEDAADCLQATFAILQEKGAACAPGARKAWLFRVASNEALKLFRNQRRDATTNNEHAHEQSESTIDTPVTDAIRREQIERTRAAIAKMPDELRAVVMLRMNEGLKFREIAERLDIPLGTALARMQAALKQLETILKDHF